jgi:hypothetical protein
MDAGAREEIQQVQDVVKALSHQHSAFSQHAISVSSKVRW